MVARARCVTSWPQTLQDILQMKPGIFRDGLPSLSYAAIENFAAYIGTLKIFLFRQHLEKVNQALGSVEIDQINKGIFRKFLKYRGVCTPVNGQIPALNRVPNFLRAIIICDGVLRAQIIAIAREQTQFSDPPGENCCGRTITGVFLTHSRRPVAAVDIAKSGLMKRQGIGTSCNFQIAVRSVDNIRCISVKPIRDKSGYRPLIIGRRKILGGQGTQGNADIDIETTANVIMIGAEKMKIMPEDISRKNVHDLDFREEWYGAKLFRGRPGIPRFIRIDEISFPGKFQKKTNKQFSARNKNPIRRPRLIHQFHPILSQPGVIGQWRSNPLVQENFYSFHRIDEFGGCALGTTLPAKSLLL